MTRVACDTYDYEMAYIKNVIKALKAGQEELKREVQVAVVSSGVQNVSGGV